jgi:hypothetical protein
VHSAPFLTGGLRIAESIEETHVFSEKIPYPLAFPIWTNSPLISYHLAKRVANRCVSSTFGASLSKRNSFGFSLEHLFSQTPSSPPWQRR